MDARTVCACLPLACQGQMHVIPAVADKFFTTAWIRARLSFAPEPGIFLLRSAGLGASVFVFERERNGAEEARALFADIASKEEGADVLANAVVEVRVPALGLVFEGFPADEDIERSLACEDGGEFGLEGAGGSKALGGSRFVGLGVVGLLLDPVAEIAVGQLLQGGVVEAVVVDEGMEAIEAAILRRLSRPLCAALCRAAGRSGEADAARWAARKGLLFFLSVPSVD